MRTEQPTKCLYHIGYGGEVARLKLVYAPSNSLLTIPRQCDWCGLCQLFSVRVSVMFHFMLVHYTFSSGWVAEWPPFWK